MTEFITEALQKRELGLALHYPLIHSAVVGLGAKRTLEIGAGGSTRVFLEALGKDGEHWSISTESREDIMARHGIPNDPRWKHTMTPDSSNMMNTQSWLDFQKGQQETFDIVLHDGSHAANVVATDIAHHWPVLKVYGLLFVHDTQHSYCGEEMRVGLRTGLTRAAAGRGFDYSMTTLPYGFGLTIIRKECGLGQRVEPIVPKAGGVHTTIPVSV